VPPHYERVAELMNKSFNNTEIYVTELVRIAIVHYQFETIHPFLDRNGRIGRSLITLYLVSSELLTKPSLYLSDFFERNRIDCYDNLTRVRTQNDLENWINFFFTGVIEVSKNSINVLKIKR
jgi:Fic family protein